MDNVFVIGIDIGTTNIKGSVFSGTGKAGPFFSISYPSYVPVKNFHEQDPFDWVNGTLKVLGGLTQDKKIKDNLAAISFSTQGGTFVPVDKNYEPLCPAITWLDRRGQEIFDADKSLAALNDWFYSITGWRLDCNMSVLPVLWLKKNRPGLFRKIYKIFYVNDFVQHALSGSYFQDPSNASISLFYNVAEGNWDKDIINMAGLRTCNFSEVRQSGEIAGLLSGKICKKLGLNREVMLINGGHDQYCSSISSGILSDESMLLATGTAWVLFKLLKKPLFDPVKYYSIGRSVIKGCFGLIYSIPAAGASVGWFATELMGLKNEKKLFKTEKKYIKEFVEMKNDIIYRPYLTGSYGPDFNMGRKASFENLGLGHNYLDMYKAILEGAGFQVKKILNAFEESNIRTSSIKMVGGAAKSCVWPQIISDITGLDIQIPVGSGADFASAGAAILAGYGAGIFKSIAHGYGLTKKTFKIIKPTGKNIEFYRNKFRFF